MQWSYHRTLAYLDCIISATISNMETRVIQDIAVLREFVQELLQMLREREHDGEAVVLALSGDLGAGKTALTKILAGELLIEEPITSPTFVIMKRYQTDDEHFHTLVHIDAYRIEALDEMRVLGFHEVLKEEGTIVCVEWAERVRDLLPPDTVHINVDINDDFSRTITIRHGQD